MVSRAEVERLRQEADTIMTRIESVREALEQARQQEGDHWEAGEIELDLQTPAGEEITVTIDLAADAPAAASKRYDKAKELEEELERQEAVVGELAKLPALPLAYLVIFHLDTVGANYPRSIAGHLDTEREVVVDVCDQLQSAAVIERIEPGTVKMRKAKAKLTEEVRQHHTYYRLTREGDHLIRFLREREGKENVLRHLPCGLTIVKRLARGGPDYPRMTANDLEMDFEHVRHCYRALRQVGLVTVYEGSTIKGHERKLKPKAETHKKHTYYIATDIAEELLRDIDA